MRLNISMLVMFCVLVGHLDLVAAQNKEPPKIRDQKELDLLLGTHPLTLQWISWDHPGKVVIQKEGDQITVNGRQEQRREENVMSIQGVITEVDHRNFKFRGTITYRVTHLNGGRPCTRKGQMSFRRTGKRKYWRLMQMDNPCDGVTDYFDIFVKNSKKTLQNRRFEVTPQQY